MGAFAGESDAETANTEFGHSKVRRLKGKEKANMNLVEKPMTSHYGLKSCVV
jgi:hypothetical protein